MPWLVLFLLETWPGWGFVVRGCAEAILVNSRYPAEAECFTVPYGSPSSPRP
jgi:hypothetical protein